MADTPRTPTLDGELRRAVEQICDRKEPPVARCRLLSKGMEAYHRLDLKADDVTGDQACLACGNCVDSCPLLRKEPGRLDDTAQRTSYALESTVGEDCEQCMSCLLACPQVDTAIKDYVVDERIKETIPPSTAWSWVDHHLTPVLALIVGLVMGMFLVR